MYIQDEKKFNNIQKLLKNKGGMEITRIATFDCYRKNMGTDIHKKEPETNEHFVANTMCLHFFEIYT
jgi:hypothetical protein